MKRTFLPLAAALLISVAVTVTAGAAPTATPGVTARTILLEGTFPLSGPASGYAPIPAAMKAFFSYVNAQGGVNHRQIVFKYSDDGYNPAQTVQITHQFVEQDHAFALVGGLGTEPQTAVRQYLNDNKVPQLFVSTGATTFDRDYTTYPWTLGWQPDYEAEGAIYGKYIAKNTPTKKIAVIYQNDSYGQDYLDGLKQGLGSKAANIVSSQPFDVTASSVASQVGVMKAANPDLVCIFATPAKTIQTYATMKALKFRPTDVYVNSVSATDTFMKLALANADADTVNGSISTTYTKDPASPDWANDAAVKLYKKIMAKYAPTADANNGLYYYGVAKAYDVEKLLYAAGKNPTRASVLKAARHMNWVNPFLLPGIKVQTSANDPFPVSQVKLMRFNNGLWAPFGSLINGRGT